MLLSSYLYVLPLVLLKKPLCLVKDNYTGFIPAICSERQKTDRILYVVIAENSTSHIKGGSFLRLKQILDVDLSVGSSGAF